MSKKMSSALRVPPQNIDAEKAVLGSIMLRQNALQEIDDFVHQDAFYVERHKIIFANMMELAQHGQPIDLVSLSNKLTEKKQIEASGGSQYLTELINAVPSSTNITYYAEIVHKNYLLRNLITAADNISDLAFNDTDQPVEDVLDQAEKKIFGITSIKKGQKFISIKHTLAETWEQIEKLQASNGEIRGVPTGFKDLDTLLSGLQKSDLIILAARPSVGKTTLALDMVRHAAVVHNIPVGIFSLEMSAQQLATRLLSAESRVNSWNLRTGRLTKDDEFMKIRDSLDKLAKAPIFIDDQAGNSITKMKSFARRLKAENGLGLIVVDYLQLMSTNKNYDSMVNQVTEISRSLKGLARELDVPVLALSQLSRAVEQRGGKPRLSDLRDSGSIEQDADVVMFIHREDKGKDEAERTNIAEILVEKHRNGPVGRIELYFDEKTTSFLSVDKNGYGNGQTGNGSQFDQF